MGIIIINKKKNIAMKLIPVFVIIIGIYIFFSKYKLNPTDDIYRAIYNLTGIVAIIFGGFAILLDICLRDYLFEHNLYEQFQKFKMILGGILIGFAIISRFVAWKLKCKRKVVEESKK